MEWTDYQDDILAEADAAYEQELARNPHNLRMWIAYLEYIS